MTTSDEKVLNKLIKRITIIGGIITVSASLLLAVTVSYGFIYDTERNIQNNTLELERVNDNLKELNASRLEEEQFKGISIADRSNIKDQLRKIEDQNNAMIRMITIFIAENPKK